MQHQPADVSFVIDEVLADSQVITVTWSGFLPGQIVNIFQCAGDAI